MLEVPKIIDLKFRSDRELLLYFDTGMIKSIDVSLYNQDSNIVLPDISLSHEINGIFPDNKYLKNCGCKNSHDLIILREKISDEFFTNPGIIAIKQDEDFLKNNEDLNTLICLLSEFGKYSRYHNLDIITSAAKPSIDVKNMWNKFEAKIVSSNPELLYILGKFESSQEISDFISSVLVSTLEKFIRALSRQFTIGNLGKKALEFSQIYYDFIMLEDNIIGTTDYRKETTSHNYKETKAHKKNIYDLLKRTLDPNHNFKK